MILHREIIRDTGLHSHYEDDAASPEDACLLGWSERQQQYFRYPVGARDPKFWNPSYKLKESMSLDGRKRR